VPVCKCCQACSRGGPASRGARRGPAGALTPEEGADADAVGITEVVYNEAHPDRILLLGAAFHMWISTDYGMSLNKVRRPARRRWHCGAGCKRSGQWLVCNQHSVRRFRRCPGCSGSSM
jgi:hypothetical protein